MNLKDSRLKLKADEDIVLFLPELEWAPSIFETIRSNHLFLKTWLPWLNEVKAPQDTRLHLAENLKAYESGKGFSLAIHAQGAFCGFVGIHGFDTINKISSIGYWLKEQDQGQGIMTRSVMRIIDYIFFEKGMNRLYIRCATGNQRSRNIPIRLGFKHEGTQREAEWLYDHFVDLEVYSLLQREWPGAELVQNHFEQRKPSAHPLLSQDSEVDLNR